MGNSQGIAPKYIIRALFEVEGVVEKSDVIGAVFGQTEGLFGPELDLHKLQETGRIGRIDVELQLKRDRTKGVLKIPSSLDKPLTALIAAAVENVDRVGPCSAKIVLNKIEDVRAQRRETIVRRAKEILYKWTIEESPTTEQITNEVAEAIKVAEVVSFGPDKLSAGPEVDKAESIIIVEGRADVANLLRSGLKNVIACEGTNIPQTLIKISNEKEVTAFLDGDRGGDIILQGLLQVAKVDFIARAPKGKEVEQLTPKQIIKALSEKIPVKKRGKERVSLKKKREVNRQISVPETVASLSTKLRETLEAVVLNEKMESIEKIPVSELCKRLQQLEGGHTIVFDGIITQRLVDIAEDKGIKRIIGERISGVVKRPLNIQLLTSSNITPKKGNNQRK